MLTALCWGALAAPAHADDYADVQRLQAQGQGEQALAKADAYIAGKPRDPQMRFLRAVILSKQGRTTEAIQAYNQVTQDFPELAEPYNNLAGLYAQQRDYDKARVALETALQRNPGYAVASENLGDVYLRLAAQSYVRARQINPADRSIEPKLAALRQVIESHRLSPASLSSPAGAGQAAGGNAASVADRTPRAGDVSDTGGATGGGGLSASGQAPGPDNSNAFTGEPFRPNDPSTASTTNDAAEVDGSSAMNRAAVETDDAFADDRPRAYRYRSYAARHTAQARRLSAAGRASKARASSVADHAARDQAEDSFVTARAAKEKGFRVSRQAVEAKDTLVAGRAARAKAEDAPVTARVAKEKGSRVSRQAAEAKETLVAGPVSKAKKLLVAGRAAKEKVKAKDSSAARHGKSSAAVRTKSGGSSKVAMPAVR
ncbi:MAG: tetratricopeptide repeat protein [Burkholderiaceae bacterium]|nr:tetratricopeptide repeat protein [Burkholderiaceae bacterium]